MSSSRNTSQSDKALPSWLLIGLFTFWILATVIGLWWFQQDKLKPFVEVSDDIRFFQPQSINDLLEPYLVQADRIQADQQQTQTNNPNEVSDSQQRTLFHFWRPDCLCNRVSQRHFSNLIKEFTAEKLRIVIIAHPNSSENDLNDLKRLNGERFIVIRANTDLLTLPSSPSLAIYDEHRQLNYFGPYGFGAFCTVREDGFLASIINEPSANSFTNVIGDGCFCPWSD